MSEHRVGQWIGWKIGTAIAMLLYAASGICPPLRRRLQQWVWS